MENKHKKLFVIQAAKRMQIYAQNPPKYVWWPGSVRTRWESVCAPPDPLASMGTYF